MNIHLAAVREPRRVEGEAPRRGLRCLRRACRLGLLVLALAACAPLAPPPEQPSPPPPLLMQPLAFPEAYYRLAQASGKRVLSVDPGRSLVVIEVRRAGSLAHLGHDHVVASHDLRGYVAPDERRADLYVRLDRLVVDEPALRAEARFDTQPSPDAIEGTRRNMLERVLEVERHPFALIHIEGDGDRLPLHVELTLHGKTRLFAVPAQVEARRDGNEIAISGRLSFRQTDFGIVPMSVLGGALQVRDEVDLRFRVVAHR